MVIKKLLEKGAEALRNESASIDAMLLLCNAINKEKSYLYTHLEENVSLDSENEFLKNIIKRKNNMPIGYILNEKYFFGYKFFIKEGVLIPRDDTEILLEKSIELKNKKRFLDMCCGSGCIGITYGLENTNSTGVMCDISDTALEVSEANVSSYNLNKRIEVIKSDLFMSVKGKYDLIMSNPPYIKKDDIQVLMDDVKDYEPHMALDGGSSGYDFYEKISKIGYDFLEIGGHLIFELGINQANTVVQILEKNKYKNIKIYKDYGNIDRVIVSKK